MKKLLFISLVFFGWAAQGQSISWPTDRPGNVNAFDNLSKNTVGLQMGIATPLRGATVFSSSIPLSDIQVRWGAFENLEFGGGTAMALVPFLDNNSADAEWAFTSDVAFYLEARYKLPEINNYHHNLHLKGGVNIPLQLIYNFGFTFSDHFIFASSVSGNFNTDNGFSDGANFDDNFGLSGIFNLAYQYHKTLYYVEVFSGGWKNSWNPGADIGIGYSINEKLQVDLYVGMQYSSIVDFSDSVTPSGGLGISYGIF